MTESSPFFSVIIPTRNRVQLFREALDSVLAQNFDAKEVIVVNDGSTGDDLKAYKELEEEYSSVHFLYLIHRPNGHGQSYSMNFGADRACGKYLCFLDDDDYWIDNDHLTRAYRSLSESGGQVYYTNQEAYLSDGTKVNPNPWIGDISADLGNYSPDEMGTVSLFPEVLLESRGFPHLNCSIFKRQFYQDINGMDENIRYECDRDIFIRSADAAELVLVNPATISYHRVPDKQKAANMSTAISEFQKRIYQLNVYEKGILLCSTRAVRDHCVAGKAFQLKHITEALVASGEHALAARYAREALGLKPGLKWWFRALGVRLRALGSN